MLIVDDDPAVVRMLERVVEDHGLGEVVGTAGDGRAAEREALRLQPDLVLLDLLMPGQDGLSTMQSLKNRGFTGTFVMISQVTAKDMVGSAYQAGVEYFVHKPLHLAEVRAVLGRVCETVQLRSTLQSIQASLAPLGARPTTDAAAVGRRAEAPGEAHRRRISILLADLGILGEAGGRDLALLPFLPGFAPLRHGPLDLQRMYLLLAEHYRTELAAGRAPGPKAFEQRLRRAAAAALTHLAALGSEDYSDPRFERLAPTFFDFTEVRAEMTRLRSGKGPPGRVNLKKFLAAFLQALDEPE